MLRESLLLADQLTGGENVSVAGLPPAFIFEGGNLVLNSWRNYGGEIKVELAEVPEGQEKRDEAPPISGRSFDDCDVITGDNLSRTVPWNGNSDIAALARKLVRVRFKLRRSHMHAIWFA